MEERKRCQSCGMPLGAPGGYGTEADGSENHEYCKFCYQNGAFTMPDLDLEGAVKASVDYMVHSMKMEEEQAEVMSRAVIPSLKRWRNGK